jgi:hypothetical protein
MTVCPAAYTAAASLGMMIKLARFFSPQRGKLYPAWQGMQYMHNMLDGRAKLDPLDNARYPKIPWTTARDILTAHLTARLSSFPISVFALLCREEGGQY